MNALDGVISLFVAIGLLRQQLPRAARIHGIVSDGGKAPNVIPERAAARIWVRALEDAVLEDAAARVLRCAEGAATATGTRLEVIPDESASPPLRPNLALAAVYRRQLERLGLPESAHAPDESIGSSDITHVSRVVPTIHPNFPIGSRPGPAHPRVRGGGGGPGGEAGLLEGGPAPSLSASTSSPASPRPARRWRPRALARGREARARASGAASARSEPQASEVQVLRFRGVCP